MQLSIIDSGSGRECDRKDIWVKNMNYIRNNINVYRFFFISYYGLG